MIRRLAAIVAGVLLLAAIAAAPASAGSFTVRACHSDGVNNSWQSFRSNAFADAYVQCPGGVIFNTIVFYRTLKGQFTARRHLAVEAASIYWHFVDVVWIGLFTTIYIIG